MDHPSGLIRTAAALAVAAFGTAALGSLPWVTMPDATGVAFAIWVAGFLVLGYAVAAISPFQWGGLVLLGVGFAIGFWLLVSLAIGSDGRIPLTWNVAAALPALLGFVWAARRQGWFGSREYGDETRVVPAGYRLPETLLEQDPDSPSQPVKS
jgi:hypothetical protein